MSALITNMNTDPDSSGWREAEPRAPIRRESWDDLPTITKRQVWVLRRLTQRNEPGRLPVPLNWLEDWLGMPFELGFPEVLDRPSGLKRAGLVAQFSLPGLGTRVGVGVETPLAHAVIDQLLGFERPIAESRLQISPVEWGIWTFLFAKILDRLGVCANDDNSDSSNRPGIWSSLYLSRVGPDPFDPTALGKLATICWTSKLGPTTGTVRLWIPESLLDRWLRSSDPSRFPDPKRLWELIQSRSPQGGTPSKSSAPAPRELSSEWRAQGGTVQLPRGLSGMRIGGVFPILRARHESAFPNPKSQIDLVLELTGAGGRYRFSAQPAIEPGGKQFIVTSILRYGHPSIREHSSVSGDLSPDPSQPKGTVPMPPQAQPPNLPVTLTVELGRVNLTLSRLADLKPGDIIELNRHTREPVELTSNGRLVARGELIKIDTELGVRITNVFL